MERSYDFGIRLRGLPEDVNRYDFSWSEDFLTKHGSKEKLQGNFDAQVWVIKKPGAIQLDFDIKARVQRACDVCLNPIPITAQKEFQLLAKYNAPQDEDPDLISLEADQDSLILDQYLYEFSHLLLPLKNRIECETMDPRPCNMEMLQHLEVTESEEETASNPFQELKEKFKGRQ